MAKVFSQREDSLSIIPGLIQYLADLNLSLSRFLLLANACGKKFFVAQELAYQVCNAELNSSSHDYYETDHLSCKATQLILVKINLSHISHEVKVSSKLHQQTVICQSNHQTLKGPCK